MSTSGSALHKLFAHKHQTIPTLCFPRARSVGDLVDLTGMRQVLIQSLRNGVKSPGLTLKTLKVKSTLQQSRQVNDLAKSYSQEQGLHTPSTIRSQRPFNPVPSVFPGTTVRLSGRVCQGPA